MTTQCSEGKLIFHELDSREVVGRFDGGEITSDAGAVLLREPRTGPPPARARRSRCKGPGPCASRRAGARRRSSSRASGARSRAPRTVRTGSRRRESAPRKRRTAPRPCARRSARARMPGAPRRRAALRTEPRGAALGDLALPAPALGEARLLGIAARHAGGPQPCVPGPAGGGVLREARPALAASGLGRRLAALRAEAPGDALGGAAVVAREVASPLLLGARLALGAVGRGRSLPAL